VDPNNWLVWLIVSPLIAAFVAFVAPRLAAAVAGANAGLCGLVAIGLMDAVSDGELRYKLGGWGAPLGIDLCADSLSGAMLASTALVLMATVVYSPSYLARTGFSRLFWPLTLFLHAALNALFLAADIFNLYVTLELLSLSAVALVALTDDTRAIGAALRYLLASLVASLAYLLGVALLYHANAALDLAMLAESSAWSPATWTSLGLMTVALAIKGALFPLHFWLPGAHAWAPAPVSAMLSALVVKAPFYVLLRLWLGPFLDAPPAIGEALGLLGAGAIVWGSIQALRQERLKLLIAYSTVAQIGFLYLFFPLAEGRNVLQGTMIFVVAHAAAKAGMFLAAGSIQQHLGHDRISELHRVAHEMPLTLAAFGIGGICIIGLPPSGSFVAKWLLATAAFDQGQWGWAILIVVGSLLSAAYVFRVIGHAFIEGGAPTGGPRIPAAMAWPAFLLSLFALLFGLGAAPLLELIGAPVASALELTGSVP
jgi:formate hydrogenlyase subunit 3/multisubunit Na+/H+ antiporter MnhD subunit